MPGRVKKIRTVFLLFFTFVLIFAVWQLRELFLEYRAGQDSYSALSTYVSLSEGALPSETNAADPVAETEPPDVSAWPQVDFARLAEINPDIVGWIYIEGTNIHYPVVQGSDNEYYLKRLFDGSYNGAGSIFLDYRCASDFSDRHSILYGHHMKDRSMFSALVNYKKQEFYEAHPTALLVTPTEYYEIRFFSGYVSDTWSDAWKLRFHEQEYADWLQGVQSRSCFAATHMPQQTDKIVTLSTCTYEFDTAKFVLHGYIARSIPKMQAEP